MLLKTTLPALVALAYVHGVAASPQVTTVLPFMVEDDSGIEDSPDNSADFSGIIVGVGAGGETTYVISEGGTGSNDVPMTATLIEGASGATAIVAFTDELDGSVATQSIACGFQNGNADCTVALVGHDASTTITQLMSSTGPADSLILVFSTSSGVEAGSGGPTDSASPSGSTQPSAAGKNTIVSLLAIVFSLSFGVALVA